MPACIIGAPGSGTSVTARMLQLAGLYLGEGSDLMARSDDIPDSREEHIEFVDLNDKILRELGGSWDMPAGLPPDWAQQDRFVDLQTRARRLTETFDGRDPWGWKDPRTSFTLPFWRDLVPELKTVVCLRHPLDVALLLQARRVPFSRSLTLWKSYYESVLATEPAEQIVSNYDGYFDDPARELARLTAFVGITASAETLERATGCIDPARRPTQFTIQHLVDADATPAILDLYAYLLDRCSPRSPVATRSSIADPIEVGRSEAVAGGSEQLPDAARRRSRSIPPDRDELERVRRRLEDAERERDALRAAVSRHDELMDLVHGIRDQIDLRGNELQSTLYELHAAQIGVREQPAEDQRAQRQRVDRLRELVHAELPQDSTVLVVSRGDGDLTKLYGRRAWHFPCDVDGRYSGVLPASSTAAIVHLEAMRALGADHLVMPSAELWWLDHYAELREHLASRYQVVYSSDDTARIYSLRHRPRGALIVERQAVEDLTTEFARLFDRDPVIVDWMSGRDLSEMVRQLRVVVPPAGDDGLPYADGSVDIVALSDPGSVRRAEATRVASAAVVVFDDRDQHSVAGVQPAQQPPEVTWLAPAAASLPSASLIIRCADGLEHTRTCLESVRQTLPWSVPCEVIVVDDGSNDGTESYLARVAMSDDRVRVVRHRKHRGSAASFNDGAEVASGAALILLENSAIPLPGWLPPLLGRFRAHPEVGVIGGKLLYPDGHVQEAGRVVFRDGSTAMLGALDPDPTSELCGFAREVDYCSTRMLATPRALFEAVGGFDGAYVVDAFAEADYCFRVRERGYRVLYEPKSTMVRDHRADLGDAGGARPQQVNSRERFVSRWSGVLATRPVRPPEPLDAPTLDQLVRDQGRHREEIEGR